MKKSNTRFVKNIKECILRPTSVDGLTTTNKPKTFYCDPVYILDDNTKDDKKKIIMINIGMNIELLDIEKLHGVLFFLDIEDKYQIRWAIENVKKYNYAKYIMIYKNIRDTDNSLKNRTLYFDKHGLMAKELGIKHIPCIVKQEGGKLKVEELSYEEIIKNNKSNTL